jgi:hypothetical protein
MIAQCARRGCNLKPEAKNGSLSYSGRQSSFQVHAGTGVGSEGRESQIFESAVKFPSSRRETNWSKITRDIQPESTISKTPAGRTCWSQRFESESWERWDLIIIRKGEQSQNRNLSRPQASRIDSRAFRSVRSLVCFVFAYCARLLGFSIAQLFGIACCHVV